MFFQQLGIHAVHISESYPDQTIVLDIKALDSGANKHN